MFENYFGFKLNLENLSSYVKKSIFKCFSYIKINKKSYNYKNENDNTKNLYDQFENSNLSYDNKESIKFETYRVLFNKSFYIYSILKMLKICTSVNNHNKISNDINFINGTLKENDKFKDDELLNLILELLYFYTQGNSENCMILLSKEFLNIIINANPKNIERLIDLFYHCLKTINHHKYHFACNHTAFRIVKHIIKYLKVNLLYLLLDARQ